MEGTENRSGTGLASTRDMNVYKFMVTDSTGKTKQLTWVAPVDETYMTVLTDLRVSLPAGWNLAGGWLHRTVG